MVGTNSTTLAPLTPNEDIAEEQHVTDSYLLLVRLQREGAREREREREGRKGERAAMRCVAE